MNHLANAAESVYLYGNVWYVVVCVCQSDFWTILQFIRICWQNRLNEKVIYFAIKTEIDRRRGARDYYFSEVHLLYTESLLEQSN